MNTYEKLSDISIYDSLSEESKAELRKEYTQKIIDLSHRLKEVIELNEAPHKKFGRIEAIADDIIIRAGFIR